MHLPNHLANCSFAVVGSDTCPASQQLGRPLEAGGHPSPWDVKLVTCISCVLINDCIIMPPQSSSPFGSYDDLLIRLSCAETCAWCSAHPDTSSLTSLVAYTEVKNRQISNQKMLPSKAITNSSFFPATLQVAWSQRQFKVASQGIETSRVAVSCVVVVNQLLLGEWQTSVWCCFQSCWQY